MIYGILIYLVGYVLAYYMSRRILNDGMEDYRDWGVGGFGRLSLTLKLGGGIVAMLFLPWLSIVLSDIDGKPPKWL